jgi:hypothetical protein
LLLVFPELNQTGRDLSKASLNLVGLSLELSLLDLKGGLLSLKLARLAGARAHSFGLAGQLSELVSDGLDSQSALLSGLG